MTTPAEVRFALAVRLHDIAQGGPMPIISGVHSVVVEGDTVHVNFDIVPGDEPMMFEFQRPAAVGTYEVDQFVRWLVLSDRNSTMH